MAFPVLQASPATPPPPPPPPPGPPSPPAPPSPPTGGLKTTITLEVRPPLNSLAPLDRVLSPGGCNLWRTPCGLHLAASPLSHFHWLEAGASNESLACPSTAESPSLAVAVLINARTSCPAASTHRAVSNRCDGGAREFDGVVGVLEQVFFTSAAYGRRLLGGYGSCDRSGTLSFVTAIRGPTAAQARPKLRFESQGLATYISRLSLPEMAEAHQRLPFLQRQSRQRLPRDVISPGRAAMLRPDMVAE